LDLGSLEGSCGKERHGKGTQEEKEEEESMKNEYFVNCIA